MTRSPAAADIEGLAADYPAGTWVAPHVHDAYQVIHARSGVLQVISETDSWFVPPGRAIWMPAGRTHAIRCRTEVRMRTAYIRGTVTALPASCAVWTVSPLMREILTRLAESRQTRGREHLAALLFLEIETADTLPFHLPLPKDRRLRRLTDLLSAEPADTRQLRQWAQKLGMSERNLIRRFGAETGMSFRQWRRQARLLAALERLVSGEQVTSVALGVGYESVSAFVAAFRSAFGEAPKRYIGSARTLHEPPVHGNVDPPPRTPRHPRHGVA